MSELLETRLEMMERVRAQSISFEKVEVDNEIE